jgi:hypothetical protein
MDCVVTMAILAPTIAGGVFSILPAPSVPAPMEDCSPEMPGSVPPRGGAYRAAVLSEQLSVGGESLVVLQLGCFAWKSGEQSLRKRPL